MLLPSFSIIMQVYRIFGQTVVFYPTDSLVDFYTSYDVMTLIDTFKVQYSVQVLAV